MGCDIHMWAEIKKRDKWETVGEEFDETHYTDEQKENAKKVHEPYGYRNYDLFAILADVRNGYGFAGCDTGDGFVPILDERRGVPDDVTELVKKDIDEWDIDGHSHHWLTLKEIIDYDWSQTTKSRGYVGAGGYEHFKKYGKPDGWCGGGNFTVVSNDEMDKLIAEDSELLKGFLKTQVEWETTYYEEAGERWWTVVEQMKELAKDVGPEKFRIVFFFDN